MIVHVLKTGQHSNIDETLGGGDMTPWQEYLVHIYDTCKYLIACMSICIGIIIMCMGGATDNVKLIVWGVIIAVLGLTISMLLPPESLFIKILGWERKY